MNRRVKLTTALAIAGAIALAGCSSVSSNNHKQESKKSSVHGFAAAMTGAGEVPPVKTDATGGAAFILSSDGQSIQYSVSVNDIKNVTAAHLHLATAKKKGPIVVVLFPTKSNEEFDSDSGTLAKGTITSEDLTGPLKGKKVKDLIKAMQKGHIFINVHTKKHEPGEIRGKLRGAVASH